MRYLYWGLIQLFYWACVYLVSSWLWVISYPFHKYVNSKWNPIWWIIHNNPMGDAWYWTKFGIPISKDDQIQPKGFKKFWISYNWSVWRNGCWRLFNTILKQEEGEIADIDVKIHESYDGKNLPVFMVLRMKFKTNGIPTDNVGTELDYDLTYQGKHFVTYSIGKRKYWMYSHCELAEDLSWGKERTFGWNGKRPLIRMKSFKL